MKKIIKFFTVLFFRVLNRKTEIIVSSDCLVMKSRVLTNFKGGGKIIIEKGCSLCGCIFRFTGKNSIVRIGKNCKLKNVVFWMEDDDNEIVIGDGVTMEINVQLAACEGTSISIGNDCMFSHDIFIRTTDSHPIYGLDGKRINCAKSVVIGNHVWVGMQSLILKGSKIADGSVIGARSLVNKNLYNPNTIYVGTPVKTAKSGIVWKRV